WSSDVCSSDLDLNDLYRRVINRNNRLKRLLELGAPEIIIRNEKRMLQEAVDALMDNGRRGRAISGTGNHKLKSLSDMLRGKQGRFRQNLLGKRVDYSGRSVIVVGNAIQIHPLVCEAFGADFDGDQMAVHVPLSAAAQAEAKNLMLSTRNVLKPADGQPVVTPRQDMVLGTYWLTLDADPKQQPRIFGDFSEVQSAFDMGIVTYHTAVKVPHNGGVVDTTVGRVIFNAVLPEDLRFVNKILDRGAIREIVTQVFDRYGGEVTAEVVDRIKTIGFAAATIAGVSISIDDVAIPANKAKMVEEAEKKV